MATKKMTKSAAARAAASANESFMAGSKPNAHAKISSIVAKHAAAGAAGHIKASTGAVPKKGMATHVTEHVSSKAKAKIAGLAASVGDKHKKVQAKVNKHLVKAEGHRSTARAAHLRGDSIERSVTAGHKERQAAEVLRKQLPQGYAMVFGKLRKITAGKPRTGIAKLKR
jgi:hypothetical protein